MDCRNFRKKHPAFLDDTLPGIETAAMREHLAVCAGCSRQDARLRRSLFLVRNIPRIEVSDGFSDRLRSRLAVEAARPAHAETVFRGPSARAFAGLAGGVLLAGLLSFAAVSDSTQIAISHPRLPSVVVQEVPTSTTLDDTGYAAPAFVASMSMGMPVWPTLLLAEQGSLRFATAELKPASLSLSPQH
jgi:putative zinc finger protein